MDTDHLLAKLINRAEELRSETAETRNLRKPVLLDQQSVGRLSRVDALQMQAMAVEVDRRHSSELKEIASALDRIASGEYGECRVCGKNINAARLEVIPTATECIECADAPVDNNWPTVVK